MATDRDMDLTGDRSDVPLRSNGFKALKERLERKVQKQKCVFKAGTIYIKQLKKGLLV